MEAIEELKASIGASLNLRNLGEYLIRADAILGNEVQMMQFRVWLRERYRVSSAEMSLYQRVARNEIPEWLIGLVSPSVLSRISTENMPERDKQYRIAGENGVPVSKTVEQMSKQERVQNIKHYGVREIHLLAQRP